MGKITYYSPAARWKEALPLGNGKIGAMVYGGVKKEIISLNDATLWSGYPRDYNNPESLESLDKARKLIFSGKYLDAEKLVSEKMRGEYSESYMPLADIVIKKSSKLGNYKRELDLDAGVFRAENGTDRAEAFVSHPAKAMFYKLSFALPKNLKIRVSSKLKSYCAVSGNTLLIAGNAPDCVLPNYVKKPRAVNYNEGKGMAFCMIAALDTDGTLIRNKKSILIKSATTVTIKIVTETGFLGYDKFPDTDIQDCIIRAKQNLSGLEDFNAEKARHIKDYTALYGRHTLELYSQHRGAKELLDEAKRGKIDKYLVNLLYDYGKYLTIAGSRDSQPLNLQGLWNKSLRPPWSSNLTTNINFEMNYWGTASCNLGDCIKPFYTALAEIAQNGKKTAKINFGARGFSCNHNSDIWRMTSPVKGSPMYMYAPLCGVWIANQAYASNITENGKAEEWVIKINEEAARFCLDLLVEYKGKLVTCPSSSPEAEFLIGNKRAALGYASAFDMGVIMQCFHNVLQNSKDKSLLAEVSAAKEKLYGFVKTSTGINEWHGDLPIAEKGHRHFSPLYALYPAKIIKYRAGGELLQWAKELFDYRMAHTNHTVGWSAAWAVCLAARLHEGERAYKYVCSLLSQSVLPNLFGYHPPAYFQIDCNFGFVAAVNEMLFYEEDGVIEFLPACPKEWDKGKVCGHKINGAEIHIEWENGKVIKAVSDKKITVRRFNIAKDAYLENILIT